MNFRPNPDWFCVQEFVSPEIYEARGERAWELMDPRILMTAQQVRERFGPVIINDWHRGGRYRYSGLRPPSSNVGAVYSQHKHGRAIDMKFARATPQEVYAYILEHPAEFPHVTTLEDIEHTPTWVHVDCRNNAQPGIRIVKP